MHNRLTHSLEVASVEDRWGVHRAQLRKRGQPGALGRDGGIASARAWHGLGIPFGHSGERAPSFSRRKGTELLPVVEKEGGRWSDFTHFEGNANAIRLLIHQFRGRRKGGFAMTYSTLASIVKYPYSSELSGGKNKFGFFASEEDDYRLIAQKLGILKEQNQPLRYARYPLVYLVEAADDICYQVMDIEDAHKLRLVTTERAIELFLGFFEGEQRERRIKNLSFVSDTNEQIAYLRSSIIGCWWSTSLAFLITRKRFYPAPCRIAHGPRRMASKAYRLLRFREAVYIPVDRSAEVELAGYRIIGHRWMCSRMRCSIPTTRSRLVLDRVPDQYETDGYVVSLGAPSSILYRMTDVSRWTTEKLTGMGLPMV